MKRKLCDRPSWKDVPQDRVAGCAIADFLGTGVCHHVPIFPRQPCKCSNVVHLGRFASFKNKRLAASSDFSSNAATRRTPLNVHCCTRFQKLHCQTTHKHTSATQWPFIRMMPVCIFSVLHFASAALSQIHVMACPHSTTRGNLERPQNSVCQSPGVKTSQSIHVNQKKTLDQ